MNKLTLNLFQENLLSIKFVVFLNSLQAMFTNPVFIVLFIMFFIFFYSLNLNKMFFHNSKDLNYKIKKFKVENFSIISFLKENKKILIKNSFISFLYTMILFSVLFALTMNNRISQTNYNKLQIFVKSDFQKKLLIDIDNPLLFLFFNQKNMFFDKVNNPKDKQILKKIIKEELKDGVITYQELFYIVTLTHFFAKKSK